MNPAVSVVTVTFGRLPVLRQKLESLAAQTLPPNQFEVLLAVNADPETLHAVRNPELPYRLEVVPLEVRQGAAAARNAAAARAAGRLLYFSDDDALLPPKTLESHVSLHGALGRRAVVVGGIEFRDGERVARQRLRRARYWHLNGVNSSLPRAAFERVGGFPEWVVEYGLEDVLLGYALHRAGLSFHALPNAPVTHVGPSPESGGSPEKARSAGRNAVRALRHHPELAWRLGVHPVALALKRGLLSPPLGVPWELLAPASYRYERAFLRGALEEKDMEERDRARR